MPQRRSPQVQENIRISRDFSFVSEEFAVFPFCSAGKVFDVSLIHFSSEHPLLSSMTAKSVLDRIILTNRPTASEPLRFLFYFFNVVFKFFACDYKRQAYRLINGGFSNIGGFAGANSDLLRLRNSAFCPDPSQKALGAVMNCLGSSLC